MKDPLVQLGLLLNDIGARMTLDMGRSNVMPCIVCGAKPDSCHRLHAVGSYLLDHPGNLRRGDHVERPVCNACWDDVLRETNS